MPQPAEKPHFTTKLIAVPTLHSRHKLGQYKNRGAYVCSFVNPVLVGSVRLVLPLHLIYIHIKLHLCVSCPKWQTLLWGQPKHVKWERTITVTRLFVVWPTQEWRTVWHVKPFKEYVTSHPEQLVYVPTHTVWGWGGRSVLVYSVHNKESSTQTCTQTRTQTHMHMHTNTHVYTHKCAHTTGADNYITDVTETIATAYTAIRHSTQTPTEH